MRNTITAAGRKLVLILLLLSFACLLPRAIGASEGSSPALAEKETGPCSEEGTEVMRWSFENGLYPDGWSWGEWQAADGVLDGRHDGDWIAAYFTPYPCPSDFAIETRVMFPSGHEGSPKAQLLIRDNAELRFESGLVLYADTGVISVRHMAWKKNLLYETYPTAEAIEYDRWYELRFALCDGRVEATLDGIPIPVPDLRYPVGDYHEPHLAVDGGSARFDYIRIISLQ